VRVRASTSGAYARAQGACRTVPVCVGVGGSVGKCGCGWGGVCGWVDG